MQQMWQMPTNGGSTVSKYSASIILNDIVIKIVTELYNLTDEKIVYNFEFALDHMMP